MSEYPPEQQESEYLHTALLEYQRDVESLTVELTLARARIAELEAELAKRHDEYAKALNRRVDVETTLFAVASGKRDALTPDECRALANKLGVLPATPPPAPGGEGVGE